MPTAAGGIIGNSPAAKGSTTAVTVKHSGALLSAYNFFCREEYIESMQHPIASTSTAPIVLVIGGGATGMGIARDASERGFQVILVERHELGSGTTGHFHGFLHSGARYAVNDPETAAECYRENIILKRIIPSAVHDTGGLFLAFDDTEAAHGDKIKQACKAAGIPTQELQPEAVLKNEPHVNPSLIRAFSVPDAFIDGTELIRLNKQASLQADTPPTFLTNHKITSMVIEGRSITHITARHEMTGEQRIIACDYVINAAGAWAGEVAAMADIALDMVYDKGTMIAFKKRYNTALLNRCRPQADGDLLVPDHTRSVLGTTARMISGPDDCSPTGEEVTVLLEEGAKMIPALNGAAIRSIYAGVRPLYNSDSKPEVSVTRQISRSFHVLDHQQAGLDNFISVVGGKVTVYRLMAEKAVDLLCSKCSVQRTCHTAYTHGAARSGTIVNSA